MHPMGFDKRRNEKLRLAKTQAGCADRVAEWTPDGHLRHSTFVGLRDDKEAGDIVREIEK